MNNLTKELIEMLGQVKRIQSNSELCLNQFQVAADNKDQAKMDEARIAGHEFLDQLFDLHQKLAEMQARQMDEILKGLGRSDK